MSMKTCKRDFVFDCIVEQPRSAPFGGRFGIIVALLLFLIALAAAVPEPRSDMPAAGTPMLVQAA